MMFVCFSEDSEDTEENLPKQPDTFLPDRESPALCQYDIAELVESYARRRIFPLFPTTPQEALTAYNNGNRRLIPAVPALSSWTGQAPLVNLNETALVELVSTFLNITCNDLILLAPGRIHRGAECSYFADPDIWSTLGSNRRKDSQEAIAYTSYYPRKDSDTYNQFTLYIKRISKYGKLPEYGMDFPILADRVLDPATVEVNLGDDLGTVRLPASSLIWAYDGNNDRLDEDGREMVGESFISSQGPEDDRTIYDEGERIEGGVHIPLDWLIDVGHNNTHHDKDYKQPGTNRRYWAEPGEHSYESEPMAPGSRQYWIPDSSGIPVNRANLVPLSVALKSGHVIYGSKDWKSRLGYAAIYTRPWGSSARSYWDKHPELKNTSVLPQKVAHLWREPLPLGVYPNTATGPQRDETRTPVELTCALLTRADARVDPSKAYVDAVTQTPGNYIYFLRYPFLSAFDDFCWFPDTLDPRTLLDDLYRWRDEHLRVTVSLVESAVADRAAFDRKSAGAGYTKQDSQNKQSSDSTPVKWHIRRASGVKAAEILEASDVLVKGENGNGEQGYGNPAEYGTTSPSFLYLGHLLRAPLTKKQTANMHGVYITENKYRNGGEETVTLNTDIQATAEEKTDDTPRLSNLTPVHPEPVPSGGIGGGTIRYGSGTSSGNVDKSWVEDPEGGSQEAEPDMSINGMVEDPEMSDTEGECAKYLPLIPDWMAPAILTAELYVKVYAYSRGDGPSWSRDEYSAQSWASISKSLSGKSDAHAGRTTLLKLSEYDAGTKKFTGKVTAEDVDALYPPVPEQSWASNTPSTVKNWTENGKDMRILYGGFSVRLSDGSVSTTWNGSAERTKTTGYVTNATPAIAEDNDIEVSKLILVVEWDFDTPLPLDGTPATCMEYLVDAKRRAQQAIAALDTAEDRKTEAETLYASVASAGVGETAKYIRIQDDLDTLSSSLSVTVIWTDDAPFEESGAAEAWEALKEAAGEDKTEDLGDKIDTLREQLESDIREIEETIEELEEQMKDPDYVDHPEQCSGLWTKAGKSLAKARKLKVQAIGMLRDAKREENVLKAESAHIVSRYASLQASRHPDEWRPVADSRPIWMYDTSKDVQFTILGTMETVFGETGDNRAVFGVLGDEGSGAYWVQTTPNLAQYLPGYSEQSVLPSPTMAGKGLLLLGSLS